MVKALSPRALEAIRDKSRRLLSRVPALRTPYTQVQWQEWVVVANARCEGGPESIALTIAEKVVSIVTAVGPMIQALGGDPHRGWDVGEITQMWSRDKPNEALGSMVCYVEWRSQLPANWQWEAAERYAAYGPEIPVYSRYGNPVGDGNVYRGMQHP